MERALNAALRTWHFPVGNGEPPKDLEQESDRAKPGFKKIKLIVVGGRV